RRRARRVGHDRRRRVRRDDHPLRRRARRGWRASGRPSEPRDDLGGRARAARTEGARRVASGTDVRDRGGCSPRPGGRMSTKSLWAAIAVCLAAFAIAACGSSSDNSGGATGASGVSAPKLPVQKAIGPGEGALNIIAWAGYAEDGSTDPKVDWVTPFEK